MPLIKNIQYKKFHDDKLIDLVTPDQLDKWLQEIPQKKRPRKASTEQCQALLIAIYYTGARPAEIVDLLPSDMIEKSITAYKSIYEITLRTVKRGEKRRTLPIPKNKQTTQLYEYAKKLPDTMPIFHRFNKPILNKVAWVQKKDYYVKENGDTRHEFIDEPHTKTYERKGMQLTHYITLWTGLPPYFFRHNRFSTMADKGATDQQIQFYKGAKNPASVAPYKNLSTRAHKELLKYF